MKQPNHNGTWLRPWKGSRHSQVIAGAYYPAIFGENNVFCWLMKLWQTLSSWKEGESLLPAPLFAGQWASKLNELSPLSSGSSQSSQEGRRRSSMHYNSYKRCKLRQCARESQLEVWTLFQLYRFDFNTKFSDSHSSIRIFYGLTFPNTKSR